MQRAQTQAHPSIGLAQQTDRFIVAMRRALVERREVVEVGDFKFRFLRRGESFEEGDQTIEALKTGVFAYFRATSGGVEIPGRWLHHGSSDDLEVQIPPYLRGMSAKDIETLHVNLSANAALNAMRAESRGARTSLADAAEPAPRRSGMRLR